MLPRDHLGKTIYTSCKELFSSRDAPACMEGLCIAIQRSDLPIQIEIDSLSVVNIVNGMNTDRYIYVSLVAEVKHL